MFRVQNITANPSQQQNAVLPDGTIISLTLYYSQQQYGWFIKDLTYGDFVLQGFRIVNSPNLLFQFRNQIPFGLACFSVGKREPTQLNDFFTNEASLYVVTQEEIAAYANFLQGQ